MNKTVCIIQARMGSSRLPGKTLKLLGDKPLLWHVAERVKHAKLVDSVVIATTTSPDDDAIFSFYQEFGLACHRGSVENVMSRYYEAAKEQGATIVVRVTGDCPLVDPVTLDACIAAFQQGSWDYLSNALPGERSYPRGLDVEVFTFAALEKAFQNAKETYELEHVAPYIWENKTGEFRISPIMSAPTGLARPYRLTVDYPEDFAVVEKIYQALYKPGEIIPIAEAMAFLDAHPEVALINSQCEEKWKQRMANA